MPPGRPSPDIVPVLGKRVICPPFLLFLSIPFSSPFVLFETTFHEVAEGFQNLWHIDFIANNRNVDFRVTNFFHLSMLNFSALE